MKKLLKRLFGSEAVEPLNETIEVGAGEFSFEKYSPKTSTTIVYLPAIDFYSDLFGKRPQRLLKELAEIGYKVVYMNSCEEYYQVDELEYPYPELPNFIVSRAGTNIRSLMQDRIVYWVNDSRLASSVETAYPNLVVFDSLTDPDKFEKGKHKMEAISDVVLITPERIYEHGRYCPSVHIITAEEFEIKERAEQVAKIIDQLPNRPAPLM